MGNHRITVTVSEEYYQALQLTAEATSRSLPLMVRRTITEYFVKFPAHLMAARLKLAEDATE